LGIIIAPVDVPLNFMIRILLFNFLLVAALPVFAQNDSISLVTEPVIDSSIIIAASTREQSKVQVRWTVTDLPGIEYFAIERASNDRGFEVVGLIKYSTGKPWAEWIDEAPLPGKNVYRLKIVNTNAAPTFTLSVIAMLSGDLSFKFYPNPVDNMLIMRSNSPYEIQLIDHKGQLRLPVIKLNGLQTLNVSSLEKGIYFLRIQNKLTSIVTQETLMKN
jgi:hypothetical protein